MVFVSGVREGGVGVGVRVGVGVGGRGGISFWGTIVLVT